MDVFADMSEVLILMTKLAIAGPKAKEESSTSLDEAARDKLREWASSDAPVASGELAGSVYLRAGAGWRSVGSDLKQGFFQEFGTSEHPPQPWLYGNASRAADRLAHALEKVEPL